MPNDKQLRHTVVASANPMNEQRDSLSECSSHLTGLPVVARQTVQTAGAFQEHFWFADDRSHFEQFVRILTDVDRVLSKVPTNVNARPATPRIADRQMQNLVRWMWMLYGTAWRMRSYLLYAELEYGALESESKALVFHPYDSAQRLPDFDPKPYLAGSATGKTLAEWKLAYEEGGLQFPGLYRAYITKCLCYASNNCVLLIVEDAAELMDQEALTRRRVPVSVHAFVLQGLLQAHHAGGNETPLSQDEMLGKLSKPEHQWSQSKHSRAMAELFGESRGMMAYKRACENGTLWRFLRRNLNLPPAE